MSDVAAAKAAVRAQFRFNLRAGLLLLAVWTVLVWWAHTLRQETHERYLKAREAAECETTCITHGSKLASVLDRITCLCTNGQRLRRYTFQKDME